MNSHQPNSRFVLVDLEPSDELVIPNDYLRRIRGIFSDLRAARGTAELLIWEQYNLSPLPKTQVEWDWCSGSITAKDTALILRFRLPNSTDRRWTSGFGIVQVPYNPILPVSVQEVLQES